MKTLIQTDKNGQPYNVNAFVARVGFESLGHEIEYFSALTDVEDRDPETICVGGVGMVRGRLAQLGIAPPQEEWEYPDSLAKFFHRKIWKTSLGVIKNQSKDWPVFIKPVETKVFSGKVVRAFGDLIGLPANDALAVWCAEPIEFVTEWRCFIRYGTILDVRYYSGAWDNQLDLGIVRKAIADFEGAPAAYSLDFGLAKSGKYALVEVNDGHSLGTYGMGAISYAKFLSARWAELTQTQDYLHF